MEALSRMPVWAMVVVVVALVGVALWMWFGPFIPGGKSEQAGENQPYLSVEEKMSILESLPPIENALTPEEKRAILNSI
jgi:hypothetical protein